MRITIEDDIQVWVPTAFTPATNGVFDGINDAFRSGDTRLVL